MGRRILVTGGAGFIGSHLVDRLMDRGNRVIVLDNLSSGKKEFLERHFGNPNFEFHKIDLLKDRISKHFDNIDIVFHMAATPDVRLGAENTKIFIEQNILATHNVLEAMRENSVKDIVFSSTSTVYGEAERIPTPEDYELKPISVYGASKLACEVLISAYCYTFGINAVILRLANVIGERSTHGVIYDFINKLKRNPKELEVLGDGKQNKSYILVQECVDTMLLALECAEKPVDIFNIGSEDQINVERIAKIVSEEMGLKPKFRFTGGKRGWGGDVPVMRLDISKIRKFGWKPKSNSEDAVKQTVISMLKG